MSGINPSIFHAYDIRGIYPDEIDPEAAYRIGRAFAKYLIVDLKKELPFSVVVGLDMRISSPFLAREVIRGLNEQGVDAVEVGKVSTPAFYHTVAFNDFAAGIMITASHNPKEYNGMKFCGFKAAGIGIGSGLEKIRDYALSDEPIKRSGKGNLTSLPSMTASYVARDLSYIDVASVKKFKIAVDPANCMGATYLEELFARIPCDLIKINWDLNGNMPIHEPNPIKVETLQQLQEVIKNEKADFGIATDGDGDRIAFLDEKGDIILSGIIIGLVAQNLLKKFPGSKIGYDLRLSRTTREMIEEGGGEPVETRVGHSYIKGIMREKDILFAGELSSHYYFRGNFNFESPVFVIGQLLEIRSREGRPFSEIWRSHVKYCQSGEINFEVADKEKAMARLEKKYADPASTSRGEAGGKISKLDGLKVDYPDWWFSVRASNTEPLLRLNLEAKDEAMMKEKIEEVSKIITT